MSRSFLWYLVVNIDRLRLRLGFAETSYIEYFPRQNGFVYGVNVPHDTEFKQLLSWLTKRESRKLGLFSSTVSTFRLCDQFRPRVVRVAISSRSIIFFLKCTSSSTSIPIIHRCHCELYLPQSVTPPLPSSFLTILVRTLWLHCPRDSRKARPLLDAHPWDRGLTIAVW